MSFRFKVESAGGVASKVRLGRHELIFDQPVSAGGTARGPSPLPVFAVSLAACAHYYLAAFLQKRNLPVDDLVVEIAAAKATEGPARLARLGLTVRLPAEVPAKYHAAVRRVVEQCPVHGTLSHPPEIGLEIVPA